jgi:hypothetical protein
MLGSLIALSQNGDGKRRVEKEIHNQVSALISILAHCFDEYSHPPSSPISKKDAVIIFMNLYFFA